MRNYRPSGPMDAAPNVLLIDESALSLASPVARTRTAPGAHHGGGIWTNPRRVGSRSCIGTRSSVDDRGDYGAACALRDVQRRLEGVSVWCGGGSSGASDVDGVDDLGVVDALVVDRSGSEVAVAELALDDDQRDAFVCHLDARARRSCCGAKRGRTPAAAAA